MKTLFLFPMIVFFTSTINPDNTCSEVHASAKKAYKLCKKASSSESSDITKTYLGEAMESFKKALNYAEICNCYFAIQPANEGYYYAQKGFESLDWEEAKSYAKKAKESAYSTMALAYTISLKSKEPEQVIACNGKYHQSSFCPELNDCESPRWVDKSSAIGFMCPLCVR